MEKIKKSNLDKKNIICGSVYYISP